MNKKNNRFRFLKLSLKLIGIFLLCFIIYFIWDIRMPTPPIDERFSLEQYERIEVAPNHFVVGNCWLKKNDYGIWEMYIE